MGIVKLINTLEANLFIDSISRNVAPKGQITLTDAIVDSDPQITQCIASGVLKQLEEEEQAPEETGADESVVETETKLEAVPEAVPTTKPESEPEEPSGNAVVSTGKGTTEVKPVRSAEIPLPAWLDQNQLRRSEAAAREFDASEGHVEELRVTDEGVERTFGGKTELVSNEGVTVKKGTDPADALPKPVKVAKIQRTDDGENDPLVADENSADDYSGAFVDESGKKPDAGYGSAFID